MSNDEQVMSFEICPEGGNPITVEGETRFVKERDYIAFKKALLAPHLAKIKRLEDSLKYCRGWMSVKGASAETLVYISGALSDTAGSEGNGGRNAI